MDLIIPPEFIPSLKNKHLLLDTNIFLDATAKPTIFGNFFNLLKQNDVTIVTLDVIKFELLKGSTNYIKYQEREKLITQIVDSILPLTQKTYDLGYNLIQEYGIEGTALTIADILLGAILMQFTQNIFLLTRDTSDFVQDIFSLVSVLNLPNKKGIHTYGLYTFSK